MAEPHAVVATSSIEYALPRFGVQLKRAGDPLAPATGGYSTTSEREVVGRVDVDVGA
jgi:hypothetical protein